MVMGKKIPINRKPAKSEEFGFGLRVLIAIALAVVIGLCFFGLCNSLGVAEIKSTYIDIDGGIVEKTVREVDWHYIFQWVIVACFAGLVWLFRGKLGISGLGPVHSETKPSAPAPDIGLDSSPQLTDSAARRLWQTETLEPSFLINKNETKDLKSEKEKTISLLANPGLYPRPEILKNFMKYYVERSTNDKEVKIPPNYKNRSVTKEEVLDVFASFSSISIIGLASVLKTSVSIIKKFLDSHKELFVIEGRGDMKVISLKKSDENVCLDNLLKELNSDKKLSVRRNAQVLDVKFSAVISSNTEVFFVKVFKKINEITATLFDDAIGYVGSAITVAKKFGQRRRNIVLVIPTLTNKDLASASLEKFLNAKYAASGCRVLVKFMEMPDNR